MTRRVLIAQRPKQRVPLTARVVPQANLKTLARALIRMKICQVVQIAQLGTTPLRVI